MKIDAHSHFVVEECSQRLSSRHDGRNIVQEASGQDSGKWNVELFKTLRDKLSDVPTRLKDMDQGGIRHSGPSPPPYMLYYWADIETGAALSKIQNDRISEICRQYPSRFIGMGTVPLQDVGLANQELERMARVLNLRGVIITSNVNGKDLDDKVFYPFFEKAESLGVLIFIHPHDTAAAQRMQHYYLTNLLGNPLDTAIAGSRDHFPRRAHSKNCLASRSFLPTAVDISPTSWAAFIMVTSCAPNAGRRFRAPPGTILGTSISIRSRMIGQPWNISFTSQEVDRC